MEEWKKELVAVTTLSIGAVGLMAWFVHDTGWLTLGMFTFYIFLLWVIPKYIRWK